MKVRFLKRMMVASVIGVVSLLGTSELVSAQQRGRERGRPTSQEQRQQPQGRQQVRGAQQHLEQQHQLQVQQQRLILQRQQQQLALQRQQQQLALQRQQEQLRLERLRQEQIRLQNARNRSVYTTPNNRGYRVYRNGGYYQTDQNGVTILQQAVNYGYQEGVRAGQSDRAYGRGFDYQNTAAYSSATYGYSYVDSNEYRYYFREGFRRGYEDGYNSRSQYGSNSNGKLSILAAILQQVLNFQAY
jgi:hypothetical protein